MDNTDFLNNVDEFDLETILQCPVCYEVPLPPILQCLRGHHVCKKCRERLFNCPTCTGAFYQTRNYLAEEIIHKLQFITKKPRLQRNTNILLPSCLPKGVFNCHLEGCKDNSHGAMGVGPLISHVRKVHKLLFSHHKNKISTFRTTLKLNYKRGKQHEQAIHVSNMGLFFLSVNIYRDNTMNCCLKLAGPEHNGNKLEHELLVYDKQKTFSHIDQVPSLSKDTEWLMLRGRGLIIPAKEHFLSPEFTIEITIVFTGKNEKEGEKNQKEMY